MSFEHKKVLYLRLKFVGSNLGAQNCTVKFDPNLINTYKVDKSL